MKNLILSIMVLVTLFCVPAAQAVTKIVGYNDKAIIFYDKNNDGKYEKIELVVFAEPIRVITAEEAKTIIATFPEGTE
jgi:hypothetical protein